MNHSKLIEEYAAGPARLRQAVAGLSAAQINVAPVAGRWSTRQVICHIADFEPVYADRMKRLIAENEPTFFGGNPDAFAARLAYNRRDIEEELAIIECVRGQMTRILRALDPADFQRIGHHSEDGPLTLATLLERVTNHIPHHVRFIEENASGWADYQGGFDRAMNHSVRDRFERLDSRHRRRRAAIFLACPMLLVAGIVLWDWSRITFADGHFDVAVTADSRSPVPVTKISYLSACNREFAEWFAEDKQAAETPPVSVSFRNSFTVTVQFCERWSRFGRSLGYSQDSRFIVVYFEFKDGREVAEVAALPTLEDQDRSLEIVTNGPEE